MEPMFNLDSGYTDSFEEVDPFNEGNVIKGYIYRKADMRYGMLYITHVNGKEVPQYVWATPKMHYPFDRDGAYEFAEEIDHIEVYEKLDGTNVLAFIYHDADGKQYVSYKTRLRPLIRDGKFGRFEELWKEMLVKYPNIPKLCLSTGLNISWELYGRRNKVMVEYDVSLDARVLFARSQTGVVYPPSEIAKELKDLGLESAKLITTIDGNSDLEAEYKKIVEYLNNCITITEQEGDQDLVEGMEGSMWYAISGDSSIQYKCKPDYIRDVHFSAAKGIPHHSIYTTCVNAFEEVDDPDMVYIKKLLLEEFQESEIERKWGTIRNILELVRFKMVLKAEVIKEYNAHSEFNIKTDKGTVMRHFAQKYDKRQCNMIFQLLNDEFGGNP